MTSASEWTRRLTLGSLSCLISTLGGLVPAASAQPGAVPPPRAQSATEALDPPGRVARLADVSGGVWLLDPETGEWTAAPRNQPLTTGDRLATDAGSRAELRVGTTTVRLDGGSELEVLRLDDERIELQLHQGSLAARLRSAEAARQFELRTAEGRFVAQRTGRLRLDRRSESTSLTVDAGQALYEGPGSALTVYENQRADFRLDRNGNAQYAITEPVRDDFAAWTADRDRADDRERGRDVRPGEPIGERLASSRYVSPEMTGAEDLDRHGRWEDDPEYGTLWVPRAVPSGWAPYSAGRWAWVRPWGWTWIDEQPWGFAPFHYGRWVSRRNVWCWSPGRYVARPVYAPALVGWMGAPVRPGVGISITIGQPGPAVGWFPLAPREVFVPGYRVTPRYVREVNVTQVTNITNVTTIVNSPQLAVSGFDYRHRRDPRAVTTVPQAVFAQRLPVAGPAADWRRDVGERGRRDWAASPLLAAPPAFEPRGLPAGSRPEPGRPAWSRGGGQRGDGAIPVLPARGPDPVRSVQPALPLPAAALPAPGLPRRDETRDDRRGDRGDPRGDERSSLRRDERVDPRPDDRSGNRRDDRFEPRRDARPPAAAVAVPGLAAPPPVTAPPVTAPPVISPPVIAPAAPPRAVPLPAPPRAVPVPAPSPTMPSAAPTMPAPRNNPMGRPVPDVQAPREPTQREPVRRELQPREAPPAAPARPVAPPVERPVERAAERPAPRPVDGLRGADERRGGGGQGAQGGEERRERGDRVERRQSN